MWKNSNIQIGVPIGFRFKTTVQYDRKYFNSQNLPKPNQRFIYSELSPKFEIQNSNFFNKKLDFGGFQLPKMRKKIVKTFRFLCLVFNV
jgi:hypothetical protein